MFDVATYKRRRALLDGLSAQRPLLFPGHADLPRNYTAATYPFRQSSHLLWLCGLDRPGIHLVLHEGRAVLYGPPEDPDDVVWHGPSATLAEAAAQVGIDEVKPLSALAGDLAPSAERVAYLPPFRADIVALLAGWLGREPAAIVAGADEELAHTVTLARLRLGEEEIAEIESVLKLTAEQHRLCMLGARPGRFESEVVADMLWPSQAAGCEQAYAPIATVRGEVLHAHGHDNRIEEGQLFLNDSGVESRRRYASDITRVTPVSGRFDPLQRDLYATVLDAQERSIATLAPGRPYRDAHLEASLALAEGLIAAGFLKGKAEDAVASGAHTLFFPHGVGHVIGIDVHDMEDLGDIVGYGGEGQRDPRFGFSYLRLARELEAGWCVTIEPGIYFIPALIDRFEAEGKHAEFIAFDRARAHGDFGGIRIEDDILVTPQGPRILGPGIPKSIDEVEELASV